MCFPHTNLVGFQPAMENSFNNYFSMNLLLIYLINHWHIHIMEDACYNFPETKLTSTIMLIS